ncbi:MAG: hypothetical protein EXQ53_06670 [Acidobacteria bacterium]|nr:hypothetical protein [Acidobacteriota bacterium]
MSSAAEARFRIQATSPTARAVRVISLDSASDDEIAKLVDEVPTADLVVMVASAGADAHAAAIIGEACSRRRVPTATCVVRPASATDEALSKTLAQIRPWSLMVVIASDDHYVEDILRSFR